MPEEALTGQEPAATTETAVTTAPVETTAPVVTETPDIFDNAEVQSFDRDYVKKLREEAAGSRTKAKEAEKFKEVFDGWDEGSQNVLLNTMALLRTDPKQGVAALKEIISVLSPEEAAAVVEAVEGEDAPELTVAEQVEKLLAERDSSAKQEAAIQGVIKSVVDAGFAEGTADHVKVLWMANYQTNGDIAKAVEQVKSERQAIIDEYIAEKTAANSAFTPATEGAGSVSEDAAKPGNLFKGDGRARVEARLAAMATGTDS